MSEKALEVNLQPHAWKKGLQQEIHGSASFICKKMKVYIAVLNLLVMHSVGRCCSLSTISGVSELSHTLHVRTAQISKAGLQNNPQQAEAWPVSSVSMSTILKVEEISSSKYGI